MCVPFRDQLNYYRLEHAKCLAALPMPIFHCVYQHAYKAIDKPAPIRNSHGVTMTNNTCDFVIMYLTSCMRFVTAFLTLSYRARRSGAVTAEISAEAPTSMRFRTLQGTLQAMASKGPMPISSLLDDCAIESYASRLDGSAGNKHLMSGNKWRRLMCRVSNHKDKCNYPCVAQAHEARDTTC
ncbi:hypothetical protein AVEN_166159-1 [Araneus ventricosus]|uniref:Uncharacterized protein n=1 Tax=Araneus ventricosus TaxID=182803 RepID=A0A4Y2X092_ARAVE|nr:hypothetical protein AVEN_141492-1 [Araneus ventricosus]GBO42360.1 hypothetical protein AVEN_166159-1 [Araneus ventricosus]